MAKDEGIGPADLAAFVFEIAGVLPKPMITDFKEIAQDPHVLAHCVLEEEVEHTRSKLMQMLSRIQQAL